MRILHTSDWHLGRVFHNVSMTEDQAHVLDQFVDLAAELRPDVVIIAGDLYDRSVPPRDAVQLLDDVLGRLVLDLGLPTIAIAGNHDSAERVGFASRLLAQRGLHLVGAPVGSPVVTLEDAHGPVDFATLPYAAPDAVRSALGDEELRGHEAALRAQIDQLDAELQPGRRRVAIGHAFVVGGAESESERALSVGGTGAVPASVFEGFDYVALGHLHRPQGLAGGRVRYSGSLLRYSFSEVDHDKSVSLVELGADGSVEVEEHRLAPRRQLRVVEGHFDELLRVGQTDPAAQDYVLVRLLDRSLILDAMARIREVYPNALHIERPAFEGASTDPLLPPGTDHNQMEPLALFETFYEQVTEQPLDEDGREVVHEVLAGLVGGEGR